MKPGDQVVRVSLWSDEGKIGERGTIKQVYLNSHDDNAVFGYSVLWDGWGNDGYAQFVAPQRIATVEEWEASEREKEANK